MMHQRRLVCFLSAIVLSVCFCVSAAALEASTLRNGSRGESVVSLQQALISLGYLKGKADGIFGNQTEDAVRAFQAARNLTVDGLAGKKTQALLFGSASPASGSETGKPSESSPQSVGTTPAPVVQPASPTSSGSGLFNGNYATLRLNDRNDRVKIMQQALIRLKYLSGSADGIFGHKTLDAVISFQQKNRLQADGLAGKKTLTALEAADRTGAVQSTPAETETPTSIQEESSPARVPETESGSSPSSDLTASAPGGNRIHLLHWFNDIKPTLGGGQHLLIYDPSSGLSWTLRIHSCGRHCDAEPLTAQDTANMLKAFGGINTWNQKGVYVRLPSGVWTIGSTHDMPHMTGFVTDNNFDGHLCVHFLRDMSETKQNDPKYGVANQETIRALWKTLTGETLSN